MKQEVENRGVGVVKIRIDGIVACSYENGEWSVVFICDETHRLNFYDQINLKRIPLAGAHEIHIKAIRSHKPDKPHATEDEEALNFEKTFNMTAGYAHVKGIRPKHQTKAKDCNCTLMKLDNAFFYMAEQTDKKYDTVDEDSGAIKEAGYVAHAAGAQIVLDAGSKLEILVDGKELISYPIKDKDELRLFFDNNCDTGKCDIDSDFKMYYNHYEDAEKPGRQFHVKRSDKFERTPGRTNCYVVRLQ